MPRNLKHLLSMVIVTLLAIATMGVTSAQRATEPVILNPIATALSDVRPAQSKVNAALLVVDPATKARLEQILPAPLTNNDINKRNKTFSAFASYSAEVGSQINGTAASHGFVFNTSVMGALSLTKPSSSVAATVYSPLFQVASSCLRTGIVHDSPPGSTSTSHYFIVKNDCTSVQLSFVINATTWANYTTTQNSLSLTDVGVTIPDKISTIRIYEDNTVTNHWSVDVYDYPNAGYVNFGSYSSDGPGTISIASFTHIADTTVNGSYCVSLGAWNIANLGNTSRWTGSSFTPVVATDLDLSFIDSGDPCFNSSTGNSSWYGTNAVNGGGLFYQVCGPSELKCRP